VTEVSVVIPNHNGTGFVGRCVAAAAVGAREVVVVDDRSTDASASEAEAAGARVLRSRGVGFSAAVDTGVAATDAPYVLVLNSDCFLEPDALMHLVRALDSHELLGLCGAGLSEPDGSSTRSQGTLLTLGHAIRIAVTGRGPSAPPDANAGLQSTSFVPLACVLARRSAWNEIGGLDEGYVFYFEDHDVCWRMLAAGWGIAVCWDARALHVGGASSSARDPQGWLGRYHLSRARYLRKRYPRGWPLYSLVFVPSALARSLAWFARGDRRWARAWLRSALARP
jgi:N-acetylglucosaminyl-diphospho-decaprenol L-rhamnosyltransferase